MLEGVGGWLKVSLSPFPRMCDMNVCVQEQKGQAQKCAVLFTVCI